MQLLREIDRSIIQRSTDSRTVEETFLEGVERLSEIHALSEPGRCYIYDGDQLLPLAREGGSREALQVLDCSAAIDRLAEAKGPHQPNILATADREDQLLAQLPNATTVALQPIYNSDDELFAVLLFTDELPAEASVLAGSEFQSSVATVGRQLSIAYEHFRRGDRERRTNALWKLFLEADLAPTLCFRDLAVMAQEACPSFGPLRLEVPPEVQILVLERTADDAPHFLTIRGTTGTEPTITKIDIDHSISGLLVHHSPEELPYFCDDPRKEEYRGVYKDYLGAKKGEAIKTEFAVRLLTQDEHPRFVGVLNLESEIENAFNMHHRAAILELASFIAPMAEVFEDRLNHNRSMQLSVSSVTGGYLDSLARIFRHGIASPLVAFQGEVRAANRIIDERLRPELQAEAGSNSDIATTRAGVEAEVSRLEEVVAALKAVHSQVDEFTADFVSDISGFGEMGSFNLRDLVEETVTLARRSHLSPTQSSLSIAVEGEQDAMAFCSRLFKQHLFSVLTNSIYSLQEKHKEAPGSGSIQVVIRRHTDPGESQEVDLNRRWIVAIWDDGIGVDAETLAKLRDFQPGPRNHFRKGSPGQGLGLVAMQRYMGSIGGWIELDSEVGEFFEVGLIFDEYREDIHGPLSTHVQGASNGA